MYEESILVVDIGSSSVKIGYSGEDIPSHVFPSTLHKNYSRTTESIEAFSAESANLYTSQHVNTNSSHFMYRGEVQDWNKLDEFWNSIVDHINLFTTESTSVFMILSNKATLNDKIRWAERLFGDQQNSVVPSICFGNSSTLSVFASGRTTGLAVECGAGITSSVPVFEGLALNHAVVCADFGGQDISFSLKKLFNDKSINIDIGAAKVMKERMAFAAGYHSKHMEHTTQPNASFVLPDGNDVTVESKVFSTCTEPLFINDTSSNGGLISQVYESLSLCDESVKKDLASSVLLSGGTSMLPGLGDRLQRDLGKKILSDPETKNHYLSHCVQVIPTSNYRERGYSTQRKHAPWIGGSLLASFESYHRSLKITRQEYDEHKDAIFGKETLLNTKGV